MMYVWIFIAIVALAVFFSQRKGATSSVAHAFDQDIEKLLAEHTPGENIEFFGYALDLTTADAGDVKSILASNITETTTGGFKYYDYVVVAFTEKKIFFLPTKITTKSLRPTMILHPKKSMESYARSEVTKDIETPAKDNYGRESLLTHFMLPGGKKKDVTFYSAIEQLQAS